MSEMRMKNEDWATFIIDYDFQVESILGLWTDIEREN